MTAPIYEIENEGAQGDLLLVRVAKLPAGAKEVQSGGQLVLAHSETGHHHAIDAMGRDVVMHRVDRDPLTCYLQVESYSADVVHHRSFDTHPTVRIGRGLWMARRQTEYTPEGMRMVLD